MIGDNISVDNDGKISVKEFSSSTKGVLSSDYYPLLYNLNNITSLAGYYGMVSGTYWDASTKKLVFRILKPFKTTAGLDSSTDSERQEWDFSEFISSAATSSTLGGIKTGYTTNSKNYAVQVDVSGNAYVNVPWESSGVEDISTDEVDSICAEAFGE